MSTYNFVRIFFLINMCIGQSYDEKMKLTGYLFNPLRYHKSVRPVKKDVTPTKVTFSQSIRSILNVDVTGENMCSYSIFKLSWKDELLQWNTSDFDGISVMSLPNGKYWTPEVRNTFTATFGCGINDHSYQSDVNASVTSDGIVTFYIQAETGAMCKTDMKYFPWDSHLCFTYFDSSKYISDQLILYPLQDSVIDKSAYSENQEWRVLGSQIRALNYTDPVDAFTKSYVYTTVVLERRPGFVLVHNLAPAWLLSFLNIFVPLIPPDSERLSFAITTYLAMIFINLSFNQDLPRNSITLCLLSYNLLVINITFTLGMLWNIFIVCLSKTSLETIEIPQFFKRLIRHKSKESKFAENSSETTCDEHELNEYQKEISWYDVSRCLDKYYFCTSLFFVIALFILMFYLILTR